MVEEMVKIPKNVKESKAVEEYNANVPAVEGIKLIDYSDGKTYYLSSVNGAISLVEVVE